MSAMSQQLRSDLGVAGTSDPPQHRPPPPKLDIVAVDADEELLEGGEQRTMTREDHWIRVKSKLPVKRKQSICGTWRCIPLKRRHGHEQDPVVLMWIDTNKEVPKPHATVSRLVCTEVRHEGGRTDLLGNTFA